MFMNEWPRDTHRMTGAAGTVESPRAVPPFAPPCAHARVVSTAPAVAP